ncbi:Tad domain-containing protein [Celeribacter sp. ULVN23_4]
MLGKILRKEAAEFRSVRHQIADRAEYQAAGQTMSAESTPLSPAERCLPLGRSYQQDEEGSLAIFGLFAFVMMLLLAGIGLDVVRHETLRVELQNTLDRAVLAATNLENTNDPEEVVTDYFAKAGLSAYLSDVEVTTQGDSRIVTAYADATISTYFMKFASVDTLSMSSYSTAEQGLSGLEISLVLDVSGSMSSYSRLTNLKTAAQEFTEVIFDNAASDELAISVIPYATQVNAGADILDTLNLLDAHDESHCINFEEDDFSTVGLEYTADETTRYYEQTMDFDPFKYNWNNLDMDLEQETCPVESSREILPFSNDQDTIDTFIQSLSAVGNTSIDLGVKWGAALLDPSAQAITDAMVADGKLTSAASGHPADASDAQKYMVVMTDGSHTSQYYMPDPYRSDDESTDVYNTSDGEIYVGADRESCSYYYGYAYNCSTTTYYTKLSSGNTTSSLPYDPDTDPDDIWEMTWADVWSSMTVYNHAYARRLAANDSDVYYDWRDATRKSYNSSTKDDRLLKICDAAKAEGVIIFAIGFEAPTAGQEVMESCASSSAHYYDVDGTEISDAFSAIASKITELRLVE